MENGIVRNANMNKGTINPCDVSSCYFGFVIINTNHTRIYLFRVHLLNRMCHFFHMRSYLLGFFFSLLVLVQLAIATE